MYCDHGFEYGKGCKECEAIVAMGREEGAAMLVKIQEDIKHSEQQHKIDSKIKSSMITKKFQEARLENYEAIEPGQKIALQKCNDFLDGFDIDKNDLVLLGGSGTGKDHLAAAMGHELIAAGKTALITDIEKIQRKVRDAYKSQLSEQSIMDGLASVDYLAINEMGIRTSEAQAAMLNEICNDRINNEKRTIYIGNLSVDEFKKLIGGRATDRIIKKDGSNIIIFDWASHRK